MTLRDRLAQFLRGYESSKLSFRLALAIAWAAMIFGASSVTLARVPRSFFRSYCHNAAHVAVYGVLSVLIFTVLKGTLRKRAAWTLLLCLGYGACDEWHQSYVPGRSASSFDVGSDLVGASWALVGLAWIHQPCRWWSRLFLTFVPVAAGAVWLATLY